MADVQKLPSGRYRVRGVVDGKRHSYGTYATHAEAQREATKLQRGIDTGTTGAPSRLTLAAYLDLWLERTRTSIAKTTWQKYEQCVRLQIKPHLGKTKIEKLKPGEVVDWQNLMLREGRVRGGGGLSPQSVLHLHRCLSAALNDAIEWGLLDRNVCDHVKEPVVEDLDIEPLTLDETIQLLQAARETHFHLPILIASCTSLRRGEILGLRAGDISFPTSILTLRRSVEQVTGYIGFKKPKNKKRPRQIALPTFLLDSLREHAIDWTNPEALLFARKDGSPWRPDYFSDAFGVWIAKTGLRDVRFHDLRHTAISQLLAAGVAINAVQRRAGHSQASTTVNRYGHAMPGADREVARVIEETIGKQLQIANTTAVGGQVDTLRDTRPASSLPA